MKHVFYVIGMFICSFIYIVVTSIFLDNASPKAMLGTMYAGVLTVTFFAGLIPAFIANSKGRNFYLWWVYGFLIFGVALIHSLIIKETEAHQLKHGMKRCPHCAELVKRKAHVCRYCGKELDK